MNEDSVTFLAALFVVYVSVKTLMSALNRIIELLETQHAEKASDLHDIRDYLYKIARNRDDLEWHKDQGIPIMKVQDGLIYLVKDG